MTYLIRQDTFNAAEIVEGAAIRFNFGITTTC